MYRYTLLRTLCLLPLLAGCAAAMDKGSEDAAPVDGKVDSFRSPTEHGTLRFGALARATLDADGRYHAWEFGLSDAAAVSLRVETDDDNLDTVMYLYRRETTSDTWGRYIGRADDSGDSLSPTMSKDLQRGLYRIIVKGFKAQHTGSFALVGGCEGSGCVEPSAVDVTAPVENEYTAACAKRFYDALRSSEMSSASYDVPQRTTTGFDIGVLRAINHYEANIADYYDPEQTLEVAIRTLETGTVVTLGDGGDESTTVYGVDASGELLAYYVYNQSPWVGYFCGEADEPTDVFSEDCIQTLLEEVPHSRDLEAPGTDSWVPGEPNDELFPILAPALEAYQARVGAAVTLQYDYVQWETGIEATFSTEGQPAVTYLLGSDWNGAWLIAELELDAVKLVCSR